MGKKLIMTYLSSNETINRVVFKKEGIFFELFQNFMKDLGIDNELSFRFGDYDSGYFNKYRGLKGLDLYDLLIKGDYIDEFEEVFSDTHHIMIFYGHKKIIVVIRTDEKNRERMISGLKKIAVFFEDKKVEAEV